MEEELEFTEDIQNFNNLPLIARSNTVMNNFQNESEHESVDSTSDNGSDLENEDDDNYNGKSKQKTKTNRQGSHLIEEDEWNDCKFEKDEEEDKYLLRNNKINNKYNKYSKIDCLLCNFDLECSIKKRKKVGKYPWMNTCQLNQIPTYVNNGIRMSDLSKGCIAACKYYENNIRNLYNKNIKKDEIELPELTAKQIKDHYCHHSATPLVRLYLHREKVNTLIDDCYDKINKVNKIGKKEHATKYSKEMSEYIKLDIQLAIQINNTNEKNKKF